MFILEDLTGSGKTEAALTLAKRLMSSGRANGIFYALPTMATANAMYSRLVDVLSKLYLPGSKPSLILAHSRSRLMEGFTSKIWDNLLKGSSEFNNETPVYAGCASWFAESSKKALLADVGVGTIDQALMGVLQFRHNNLRLLGLEKKVFIVDEVHAYDAYMGKELEQLISVLAYYGAPIILLSATMSQTQRTQYLSAFQSVLSVEPSKDSDVETLSYPLFTKADSNGIESREISMFHGSPQRNSASNTLSRRHLQAKAWFGFGIPLMMLYGRFDHYFLLKKLIRKKSYFSTVDSHLATDRESKSRRCQN